MLGSLFLTEFKQLNLTNIAEILTVIHEPNE